MAVSSQEDGLSTSDTRKGRMVNNTGPKSYLFSLREYETHWLEWISSGKKSQVSEKQLYTVCIQNE